MEPGVSRRRLVGAALLALAVGAEQTTPFTAEAGGGVQPDFQTGQITVFDKDRHKVDIAQGGDLVTVVNDHGSAGRGEVEFSTAGIGQIAGIVHELCGGEEFYPTSRPEEYAVLMRITEPHCIDLLKHSSEITLAT